MGYNLCGELLPTLEPSASENVASVLGAHALAEAVNLFPLPNFGLIGHLHDTVPLS